MLPQKNRVTTEEFLNVLKNGKRILSPHISLVYIKNNLYFKGSIVVSKKIFKKAPERNRQKRILREAVKKTFLKDNFQCSCLFFIQKNITKVSFTEILEEVTLLSKKIY